MLSVCSLVLNRAWCKHWIFWQMASLIKHYFRIFMRAIGSRCILMDCKARSHKPDLFDDCLERDNRWISRLKSYKCVLFVLGNTTALHNHPSKIIQKLNGALCMNGTDFHGDS
ncbi:hypothetical protein AVEN_37780-1 [Araneus ventricosus]|uniref:Uncharacterized protein n=1 Tax=Araneus ventricosus TaxID=182803 RepID=A0A4Y2PCE7_ARAVE|nr:hypothetical protein AVEN_37780-1 [Araneus ventricosus]